MEFEYSPIRHPSPIDQLAILSPTHAHITLDGFSSIRQLRRSLSRSPSKPARLFHLNRSVDSSSTPVRVRAIPLRTSTRKISPNSPLRRALSDNNTNQPTPVARQTRRASAEHDQENAEHSEHMAKQNALKFDEPIKFELSKARPDHLLQSVFSEHVPPRSSPLKRSDGKMHLHEKSISPRAKRRSIHGTSFGQDFNVFEQAYDETPTAQDVEQEPAGLSSTPTPYLFAAPPSPLRRGVSLRKSTLQQRSTPARTRHQADNERQLSPALTRARSRISLDGSLPLRSPETVSNTHNRRRTVYDPPVMFLPPGSQRAFQSAPKPHPLSNILSPSSSTSSMAAEESTTSAPQGGVHNQYASSQHAPRLPPVFSRSLPLGAMRPSDQETTGDENYATPAGYKMAKPLPQAFMSTGLISKRNYKMDFTGEAMPDTPSKPVHAHVLPNAPVHTGFGKFSFQLNDSGSPNTPFTARTSDISPEVYRNSNIFAARASGLVRRGSFLSVDDHDQSQSPTQVPESQSSADELPPTPTKSANAGQRPQSKGKSNSLRSSLFGRRSSLGPDTFNPPNNETTSPGRAPIHIEGLSTRASSRDISPSTPSDHLTPPDASRLSISAEQRSSSLFPSNSFPPATPTGPRDQPPNVSLGHSFAASGYFANDVDTALTSRFGSVTTIGMGEFSQVYKVQGSYQSDTRGQPHTVWAVKKSRKPYNGHKDRQRKMQEVRILQQLRGHEHVVEYVDSWESKGHLYIQTQFCENGNLKDFLTQTGFKGRLDDFRIYKILLEMGQGLKAIHDAGFIHLDIKPANVFIDWEGVLKIGDFGLASTWPAPSDLDGEGDREYIAPEVLVGRFDKPADVFSLGMIMLEIAGNIVLPDNGKSWQRLRAGDMTDLPSLTWSSDTSLVRNDSGEPVDFLQGASHDTLCLSNTGDDDLSFLGAAIPLAQRGPELVIPPNFMVDPHDPEALDKVVQWMIHPDPDQRPVTDDILNAGGVRWVEARRRSGASIYEGDWGPADEVLGNEQDVEMVDL